MKTLVRQEIRVEYEGKMDRGPEGIDLVENTIRVMLRFKIQSFSFIKKPNLLTVYTTPELVRELDQAEFADIMLPLFDKMPLKSFNLSLSDEIMAADNPVFEVTP